jgi:hypothetical protein
MTSCHHRLLLRAERRENVWRLSGFDAVYLRDEIAPVIPGQGVAIDPEAVKAFRPSYRLLSYCLASGGFPGVRGMSALPPILTVTADMLDRQLGARSCRGARKRSVPTCALQGPFDGLCACGRGVRKPSGKLLGGKSGIIAPQLVDCLSRGPVVTVRQSQDNGRLATRARQRCA